MLLYNFERTVHLCRRLSGTILVTVVSTAVSNAQIPTAARPDRGLSATSAYSLSDIENINLSNGNVNLSIPLASLPPIAGGKVSAGFKAVYNSKLWDVVLYDTTPNPQVNAFTDHIVGDSDVSGWVIGAGYRLNDVSRLLDYDNTNSLDLNDQEVRNNVPYQHKMVLTGPDGAKHELRPVTPSLTSGTLPWAFSYYSTTPATISPPQPIAYYSFDGSFLWATIDPYPFGGQPTSWEVYNPDGSRISFFGGVQKIRDTNGNRIDIVTEINGSVTTTRIQDHLTNREITYTYTAGEPGHGQIQYYIRGLPKNIEINFVQVMVHGHVYPIGDPCAQPGQREINQPLIVIRSIVLPESEPGVNLQYSFAYNCEANDTASVPFTPAGCGGLGPPLTNPSHGWGSLSHIALPSGAAVDYTYHLDGVYTLNEVNDVSKEGISQKKLTHDGVQDIWDYTKSSIDATVHGPDGSLITEDVYLHDDAYAGIFGGSGGRSGLTYRTTYSGTGGPIEIIERHWTGLIFTGAYLGVPGGGVAMFNPVVDYEYTTLLDSSGQAGPTAKISTRAFQHDFNGNITSISEYDFVSDPNNPSIVPRDAQHVPIGIPVGAQLQRTTTNTYYNTATTAGSANVYAKRSISPVAPLILNALQRSVVGPSETRLSYDGLSYGSPPTVGNLTREARWDDYKVKFLETTHTYDGHGNRLTITQPSGPSINGNTTTFVYDQDTQAQPTSITVDPLNGTGPQTSYISYDYSSGLVLSQTDVNDKVTSFDYTNQLTNAIDPFGRVGIVTGPAVSSSFFDSSGNFVTLANQQRTIVTRYFDSFSQSNNASKVEVWADLKQSADGLLKSRTTADQLGRPVLIESSENGSAYSISSQTRYDQMGRITYVSNPTRNSSESTDGWTRTTRDGIGRQIEAASFSGAAQPPQSGTNANWTGSVFTSYNTEQTTVTDQAGKKRRSFVDALGRLKQVDELFENGSLYASTTYSYDTVNNLTQANQGVQQREFVYDSLSRLRSAKNPEHVNASGQLRQTVYDYDDASNLISKTNPGGASSVTFTYDGLNRVATKTLSTGGAWTYNYDVGTNYKGRMVSEVLEGSTDGYYYDGYDAAGRVTASRQITTVAGTAYSYSLSYKYDLSRNLTSQTYPSNKEYRTNYDNAGRVSAITRYNANVLDKTYASLFSYTAHGAVAVMRLGNSKWEHSLFDSRLQPTEIGVGVNSGDSGLLRLQYTYGVRSGQTLDLTKNNGNLESQTITAPATGGGTVSMTQSYLYDHVNRLSSATEGTNWSQGYGFDQYGNRWVSSGNVLDSTLTPQHSTDFVAATNRLSASLYDIPGNQTQDAAGRSFAYDSENHQTSFNNGDAIYRYDCDGRRVAKAVGSETTVFVYNVSGKLIAEYTSGTPSSGGTSYLTSDHLGSTRVVTDGGGGAKSRHDYLPFGEEIPSTLGRGNVANYGISDGVRQKFTQKERDNESGLDYFLARYYSSGQGRFTSADPLMASARTVNPQTWNRFVYVINNPLRYVDPSGMDEKDAWGQLSEEEQKIIRGKLANRTVTENGQKRRETDQEAFNRLVGNSTNGSSEQIAQFVTGIKNFIDNAGGHENSSVWQAIHFIDGGWVGSNNSVGIEISTDRGFLGTLRNSGQYDVDRGYEKANVFADHLHSARFITGSDPLATSMHIVQEKGQEPATIYSDPRFFVHWDSASVAYRTKWWQKPVTPLVDAVNGVSHEFSHPSAAETRRQLTFQHIVPKNER